MKYDNDNYIFLIVDICKEATFSGCITLTPITLPNCNMNRDI